MSCSCHGMPWFRMLYLYIVKQNIYIYMVVADNVHRSVLSCCHQKKKNTTLFIQAYGNTRGLLFIDRQLTLEEVGSRCHERTRELASSLVGLGPHHVLYLKILLSFR